MQLSPEQIDHISRYLESKGLYHLDVKQEVLDHMASSIAHRMETENRHFQYAFEVERG